MPLFDKFCFSLIACCPKLNVLLENDIKDKQGQYEGVYTFHGFSNEMDYWVDADGEHAIWFNDRWNIGYLTDLGSLFVDIYSSSNSLIEKCPNNEGYVWNWIFWDVYFWTATYDVYIKCANEDDFCTSENPCVADQGDCDTHNECQDGIFCGSNNCPDSLGFHSEFDCCYAPTIGDEHFCTSEIPCGEDEGDCDSHAECQAGLACGSDNCPASLGFDSEVDCCYPNSCPGICGNSDWKSDDYCDDGNNNCGCEWDGGDCCGSDVNTDWCSACECLDPGFNSGSDSSTTSASTETTSDSTDGCEYPDWISDNYCDDANNNEDCEWDGGDCCGSNVNTAWCSACECLDPNSGNSRKQSIIESVSDYRKIRNPRKISISKQPTYNKERMLGLRPQQLGLERKRSPNPDFRKHSRYTNVEGRRFEDVIYTKRMLSRNKMDSIIKRNTETSDFSKFRKHLSLQHPRHSTKEDRMSRLRSQHFSREYKRLSTSHFRNDPMYHNAIANHPNYFHSEEKMLLNPQFLNIDLAWHSNTQFALV